MKKFITKLAASIIVASLLATNIAFAGNPFEGLKALNGALIYATDAFDEFGSAGVEWEAIYTKDLYVSDVFTFGGAMGGNLDLDGFAMLSDTDGDWGIFGDRHASVGNDEFAIGKTGALDVNFGVDTLTLLSGSSMLIEDGNLSVTDALSADGEVSMILTADMAFESAGADVVGFVKEITASVAGDNVSGSTIIGDAISVEGHSGDTTRSYIARAIDDFVSNGGSPLVTIANTVGDNWDFAEFYNSGNVAHFNYSPTISAVRNEVGAGDNITIDSSDAMASAGEPLAGGITSISAGLRANAGNMGYVRIGITGTPTNLALFGLSDYLFVSQKAEFADSIWLEGKDLTAAPPTITDAQTDDFWIGATQVLNDANVAGGSDTFTFEKYTITETDITGLDNIYFLDYWAGSTPARVFAIDNDGLTTTTDLSITDSTTFGGNTIYTPSSVTSLAAVDTLTVSSPIEYVDGVGAVTLTSTPNIANGTEGQCVTIFQDDAADTVTFQDEDNLANSGLALENDSNIFLQAGDSFRVCYTTLNSVTLWREQYRNLDIDD